MQVNHKHFITEIDKSLYIRKSATFDFVDIYYDTKDFDLFKKNILLIKRRHIMNGSIIFLLKTEYTENEFGSSYLVENSDSVHFMELIVNRYHLNNNLQNIATIYVDRFQQDDHSWLDICFWQRGQNDNSCFYIVLTSTNELAKPGPSKIFKYFYDQCSHILSENDLTIAKNGITYEKFPFDDPYPDDFDDLIIS